MALPRLGCGTERTQASNRRYRLIIVRIGFGDMLQLSTGAYSQHIPRLAWIMDSIRGVAVRILCPGIGVIDIARRDHEQPRCLALVLVVDSQSIQRGGPGGRPATVSGIPRGNGHAEHPSAFRCSDLRTADRLNGEVSVILRVTGIPVIAVEQLHRLQPVTHFDGTR